MTKIPEIELIKGNNVVLEPRFYNSVGGKPIREMTVVELLYDGEHLVVTFECLDDPFVDFNTYTKDNSDLWNQEVFEVFIASGSKAPVEYIEIEINPNNALFVARITNPDKLGNALKADLILQGSSGITHNVVKGLDMWKGSLKIPLSLVRLSENDDNNIFRLNFYRTILMEKPDKAAWESTKENTVFACWSSTMAEEPAFHRSEYFGKITLKD